MGWIFILDKIEKGWIEIANSMSTPGEILFY
jgi:hypothetical protein